METVCWLCIIQALLLLLAANGAPIMANVFLGKRWDWPIDAYLRLPDQSRLIGDTKTWRGWCAALSVTSITALLLDLDMLTGLLFGLWCMLGDLLASFLKRRRSKPESSHAPGFDTLPESLLPLLIVSAPLHLGSLEVVISAGGFYLIEEFISPLLYRWHIRKRPY